MSTEITCPKCEKTHNLGEEDSRCRTKGCEYRFKVFTDRSEAEKFYISQPSIEPRRIIEISGFSIVTYRYEEIQPVRIKRLSDLIEKKTLKMLSRGFGHILRAPLTIIEPNINQCSGHKSLGRIEPVGSFELYNKFCQKIKYLPIVYPIVKTKFGWE